MALKFLKASLRIRETQQDEDRIGTVINRIGTVHYYQRDFESALECFKKNKEIQEKRLNHLHIGDTYNNIAEVYKASGEYEIASENYEKALALYEELDYEDGIVFARGNLGNVHRWLENFETSFNHLKIAINCAKKTDSYYIKAGALFYMIELLDQNSFPNETVESYVEELEAITSKTESAQVRNFMEIANALIWKNSSKITDRIRAKTIFTRKISNKSRIEEYTLPSFIHLFGVLLQDLKDKQNTDSIKKIEDLSNSLIEFANDNNSLFLQIKSNFLKSRIYLLNSNYVQSNLSLKMAEKLTLKYQNRDLVTKFQEEKTTITNKIELLKKNTLNKNNSINEIIQITEIEDAIKNLVK